MRIEQVAVPMLRQLFKRPRLANALMRFDPWGNSFGEEATADPFALLPVVRADGPVIHRRLYQQWFVNGYEEARTVLSSPDVISSQQIDVMLDIRPYTKLGPHGVSFLRNFLLVVDPPDHTRLRSLVNRAFTPRQVARLDERMDDIIDGLIEDLDGTPTDLVNSFNAPFPVYVIAELLGVPSERWKWIRRMSSDISKLLDPFRYFDIDHMNKTLDEFHTYVTGLAEERRKNPKDDLMTGLALAEQEGDRLSEDELVAVFGLILFAGHETTAGVFGTAQLALARFPEQRTWIRDNPDQWPNAVDELLRFDTAVKADPRSAVRDIHVGGTTIPAGSNITVMVNLANRDIRRFDDPDVLKLDRHDPAPLSFGHGIHYCIGANLARMELRKGLHRLIDVLGDYTVDESAVTWTPSITIRSPLYLPVRAA